MARRGAVAVENVEDPVAEPGQVLVAPRACGICGSDIHLVESQAAAPDLVPPMVLGHEFVAEILDYGPATSRILPPGTLVTSVPFLDTAGGHSCWALACGDRRLAERMVLQESRLLAVPEVCPLHTPR